MQQIFNATTKIVIDQKSGNNLLMLPMDKLMQLTAQGSAAAELASPRPAPEATSPPPADPVPASRREGMRSRDREGGR
jgi:membrane protease subunit HflK